jgi:hypothetical protein
MQNVQALEIGIAASPPNAVAVASSRQAMPSSTRAQPTSVAPRSASPSISKSTTPNRRPSSAACAASSLAVTVSPAACAR